MRFHCVAAILLLSSFCFAEQADLPQRLSITPAVADDMALTLGFYAGQKLTLSILESNFPNHRPALERAQAMFEYRFGAAIKNIDTILTRESADWRTNKTTFVKQIKEHINGNLTESDALRFVDIINQRASGNIESPILEILLIYDPTYMQQPAMEFSDGFAGTFDTASRDKSKGLDLTLRYPMSWEAKEGRRPNIVQVFVSKNGRGEESIVFGVKEISLSDGQLYDSSELFSDESIQDMLPPYSTFVSANRINLDGQPGCVVEFDTQQQTAVGDIVSINTQYITYYDGKLIYILCSLSALGPERDQLNERHKKYAQLFKLIANSLVIRNQYKK